MKNEKLFQGWANYKKGMDPESIKTSLKSHLEYSLSKDQYTATMRDIYQSLALTARDRMVERWIRTQSEYYKRDAKRVYYLSAEFLLGRVLVNNLINLGIYDETRAALKQLDLDLEQIAEQEPDPGLGNGGLGRLAACFIDSLATLEIPAYGYGIRYEYGIFRQAIRNGRQVELPDLWLKYGNPWEIPSLERTYQVCFGGHTIHSMRAGGRLNVDWVDTDKVIGVAYDTPIDGYDNETVNTLRLWSARASTEFDFQYFNHGDYLKAVEQKNLSETISKVLYPNDSIVEGQELRLKQQYFFVSCSLQDIIRRYLVNHKGFDQFPAKAVIQLNDTHPALAVIELMRLFIDQYEMSWERAWEITAETFAFTNHTLLAEALERWPVSLFERLLPRHLQIAFELNRRFLREVAARYPGDQGRVQRMSLFEEAPEKKLRMAHVAIVGSKSINGVSQLHTDLLMRNELREFAELYPERFNNKTNGVTPRRWILAANPGLARLLTKHIGPEWPKRLEQVEALEPLAKKRAFREQFRRVKMENKQRLARTIKELTGVVVDESSIFDVQIKRIHEYKRQLLNLLHVVSLWLRLRQDKSAEIVPRTFVFAGKAAPGYDAAKRIIALICHVAEMINQDKFARDRVKVVFLPDYSVTLAEKVIAAADVSEQISTAGYEASGTSNMKFMMNGALTIGTLDGANVEMASVLGDENIFIFGLKAGEVDELRGHYYPREYYERNPQLKEAVDLIASGFFCPEEPGLFQSLTEGLLNKDPYMVFADFEAYAACHAKVTALYQDQDEWTRRAVINVARSARFSSDRTVSEYNDQIWKAEPVKIVRPA